VTLRGAIWNRLCFQLFYFAKEKATIHTAA